MKQLAGKLKALAVRYGLRDIYVFGSRAKEIADHGIAATEPASGAGPDLDVAVQPEGPRHLSARDRVRLAGAFEDLFRVARVDLVVLTEARPFLAAEIVSGELLYTADALRQAEHELYILRRAADLAPFHSERIDQILTSGAR